MEAEVCEQDSKFLGRVEINETKINFLGGRGLWNRKTYFREGGAYEIVKLNFKEVVLVETKITFYTYLREYNT